MNNSPRLNQQLIDLQIEIDIASTKLHDMRQVLILETRVEEKLRLEHHIESTEKILDQLHQQYDDLEKKLEEIGLKELPDAAKNPYKSLAAFQEEDAEQFFGRQTFVKLLIEKYQQVKILPLLGPSGSGKSSVARAGLIPELKQIDIRLKTLILTPTDRPLENLANHLARLMTQDPFPIAKTKEFEDFLLKEKDALRRILSSFISSTKQTIVILIDQFEEIYTLCKDKTQQTAFIENILTLNEEQHLSAKIVLTLRSDFLGETQQHSKLNQLLAKDSVIVPAMNENELRDAIAQPAELAGHSLDEATVNLLLEQTEGRASALPLLQFALTQIWDNLSKGISAAQTLSECGGVGGALTRIADTIFLSLIPEERTQLRYLFVQMIHPGEYTEDTRQIVLLRYLNKVQRELVKELADARLVVTNYNEQLNEETVEVAHEALIKHWQRLREWVEEDRAFRVWQEGLRRDIRDDVPLRDKRLVIAKEWLQKREAELSKIELKFIQSSIMQRNAELAEYEENINEKEVYIKKELFNLITPLKIDYLSNNYSIFDKFLIFPVLIMTLFIIMALPLVIVDIFQLASYGENTVSSIIVYLVIQLIFLNLLFFRDKAIIVAPYIFISYFLFPILLMHITKRLDLLWFIISAILLLYAVYSDFKIIQKNTLEKILPIANRIRVFKLHSLEKKELVVILKKCPKCNKNYPCFVDEPILFLTISIFFRDISNLFINFINSMHIILLVIISISSSIEIITFVYLPYIFFLLLKEVDGLNIDYMCINCGCKFKINHKIKNLYKNS
jgi:hypothetical protein